MYLLKLVVKVSEQDGSDAETIGLNKLRQMLNGHYLDGKHPDVTVSISYDAYYGEEP